MSSVNKHILLGRVGKQPEVKNFQNGGSICNFSIATTEKWKDKTTGETKEKTDWHNISCNNPNLITVIQKYVNKGDKIYVEGKSRTRSWEKDGHTNYVTETIIDNLVLIEKKNSDGGQSSIAPSSDFSSALPQGVASDDLPF
jgi:single-strand DNA-binding protein